MKSRYILLGSALVLALPLSAQAETNGFYIGGAAGADFAVDSSVSGGGHSGTVRYDVGPTGLLSFGYGFGAFRAEVEGAYTHNDVSGVSGLSNVGGSARTWNGFVNGFYDINTGTPFTPYIGAGIGVAFFHASLSSSNYGVSYNGDDTTFAYQAIAGASYAVTPQLSLTLDYRYVASTDATIKAGNTSWKVDNANHVVTAGLRWAFSAPAQMAEAVMVTPPPAPPTEYMVFFDWDKYNIDAKAHAVIADAAAAAAQIKATVIVVTGNTDTTGSNQYNQALSERRAEAVKQELLRQGLSPDLIQTVGHGKTDLLVPTPDEVKERQNRRAVIILRVG